MSVIAYVNGKYLPESQASVSIFDRGFLFADAVYEVTAVIQGKLVDFSLHMARLARSCHELSLPLAYSEAELEQIHHSLMIQNQLTEGLIYLQLTRGNPGVRSFLYPEKQIKPTLVLFTQPVNIIEQPLARQGIRLVTCDDIRWLRRDIKTVALLAASMAKEYAHANNADDALLVQDGFITEGSSSNCFIYRNNKLITRELSQDILPGITRRAVLQLAKEQNLMIEERAFTLHEAIEAQEVFITSATTLIWPVISIDGHPINNGIPGPIAKRLREIYLAQVTK
ncbi:D-amino-acid transaminase [Moellerella wisconsensis]|uniref:D-amino-acid transaminase n=1 Tax=Moellerella wisconsensis TaxID=158849 RepID=UPI00240FA4D1|nr:D-amino-acid transaminase [Moellerella wisconsensis]